MATAELIETEAELKERILRRIESIHDVDELKSLFAFIDEIDVYELTPEEEKMLDEAEAELDAGLGIPGDVFHKETQEWLKNLKIG